MSHVGAGKQTGHPEELPPDVPLLDVPGGQASGHAAQPSVDPQSSQVSNVPPWQMHREQSVLHAQLFARSQVVSLAVLPLHGAPSP